MQGSTPGHKPSIKRHLELEADPQVAEQRRLAAEAVAEIDTGLVLHQQADPGLDPVGEQGAALLRPFEQLQLFQREFRGAFVLDIRRDPRIGRQEHMGSLSVPADDQRRGGQRGRAHRGVTESGVEAVDRLRRIFGPAAPGMEPCRQEQDHDRYANPLHAAIIV